MYLLSFCFICYIAIWMLFEVPFLWEFFFVQNGFLRWIKLIMKWSNQNILSNHWYFVTRISVNYVKMSSFPFQNWRPTARRILGPWCATLKSTSQRGHQEGATCHRGQGPPHHQGKKKRSWISLVCMNWRTNKAERGSSENPKNLKDDLYGLSHSWELWICMSHGQSVLFLRMWEKPLKDSDDCD